MPAFAGTSFADFFAFESAFAKAMADKIGFELALFCAYWY